MNNPSEKTFGPHYGSELDFNSCEILAIQHIERKILKNEAVLYQTKWFDYRTMHPTAATYLFVHFYNQAYGTYMATCLSDKKRFMAAFKGKDFITAREKRSFWKLRQKIDELGIRYDFYLAHAMNWCMDNGWLQPPRPAHLWTNADLTIEVMNAWEMECRAKVQFAKADRYLTTSFVNGADQRAYEQHLVDSIMKRAHPKFSLHAALYIQDALRIETAVELLPAQVVQDAIEICHEQ